MSSIKHISREFGAGKIPNYAETRILYWKLDGSKRIKYLINDYLIQNPAEQFHYWTKASQ